MSIPPNQNQSRSLSTRLALLELLTRGDLPSTSDLALYDRSSTSKPAPSRITPSSVVVRTQEAHAHLQEAISNHRPIVHFVSEYKQNLAYLLPKAAFAHGDDPFVLSPKVDDASADGPFSYQAIMALLLDSEQDLAHLERGLRECQHLNDRDVIGSGRLPEHRALRPRLQSLTTAFEHHWSLQQNTERQAFLLMERYTAHVDRISQLFLHWDEMLTSIEDSLSRFERAKQK